MVNHQILYKRTKTGAIQYWKITVRYCDPESNVPWDAYIEKESGQLGTTNPMKHIEIITEGKNIGRSNETTPFQQAESQALSDWTKKHDEGYKTAEDLGIAKPEIYADKPEQLENLLQAALPQFNTDAKGNVKPMLAKAVDWKKVTYPCLVQPKLDGVRCLMIVEDGKVTFLSRNGKPYTTLMHIEHNVLHYILANNGMPKFILDGEIYSDEISFQEIIAAVKKQRPDSLKLKFRAYDIVNDNIQGTRIYDTEQIVSDINSKYVKMVITVGVEQHEGKAKVMELHNMWVSEGNEGAMIRLLNGKYGQGQRSSALLKVKEFDSNEFQFVRWEYGQREEDLIAVCSLQENGVHSGLPVQTEVTKEFRAKMIGTAAAKKEMPNKYRHGTGSITIKHFGFTDDGLPRFPIGVGFRDYE